MMQKRYVKQSRKVGFTIIESLVYIFVTTIVLVEGINIFTLMYKSYIESSKLTIEYNDLQNFYINLDNMIGEDDLKEILLKDDYILFSYGEKKGDLQKMIRFNDGKIVLVYMRNGVVETINIMLENIDKISFKQKEKLIYLIVKEKDGKEFVRCI